MYFGSAQVSSNHHRLLQQRSREKVIHYLWHRKHGPFTLAVAPLQRQPRFLVVGCWYELFFPWLLYRQFTTSIFIKQYSVGVGSWNCVHLWVNALSSQQLNKTHLSKRRSDLRYNGTHEKKPFSASDFHALPFAVFRFVASVSFNNYGIEASDWLSKNFNQSKGGFQS